MIDSPVVTESEIETVRKQLADATEENEKMKAQLKVWHHWFPGSVDAVCSAAK